MLEGIAQLLLVSTPVFPRLRLHPEYEDWAAHLLRLGEREELRPLAGVLRLIVDERFEDLLPITRALHESAQQVGAQLFVKASDVSLQAAEQTPHAAFVLAWIALVGWTRACGKHLYDTPHAGWLKVPYSAAELALRFRGLFAARFLVEHCHAFLQVQERRYPSTHPSVLAGSHRYRQVGRRIHSRYELAVSNLADDLRDHCVADAPNLRPEVGALPFSLGRIPECRGLLAGRDLPSSHFFRHVVRESMRCVPHDSLIQYVWLELKDRPCFNLRDHEALFAVINHDWDQWLLDSMHRDLGLPAPPSRVYARTLIRFLQDGIDPQEAATFLGMYAQLGNPPYSVPWLAWQRLHMLRNLLGEKFGYLTPRASAEEGAAYAGYLQQQIESARRRREAVEKHPELPEIGSRLSCLVFDLMERSLAEDREPAVGDGGPWIRALETLEQFRTGALSFWLRISPPLPPVGDDDRLRPLLEAEARAIEQLRGAYFLALKPLVHHFQWADLDHADFMELQDPDRREWFWSPDVGRAEMSEIEEELTRIGAQMSAVASAYGQGRLRPVAEKQRLIEALNQHTRPNTQRAE